VLAAHRPASPRDHAPASFAEIVPWTGDTAPPAPLGDHFDVRTVAAADLARYGIEAAPALLVIDPGGRTRYAGGYTERKQGPDIEDLRLMAAAQGDEDLAGLPLFGCAVSDRLRRALANLPVP
jgi:hypothetical protein